LCNKGYFSPNKEKFHDDEADADDDDECNGTASRILSVMHATSASF